jgi:hypothetical protein
MLFVIEPGHLNVLATPIHGQFCLKKTYFTLLKNIMQRLCNYKSPMVFACGLYEGFKKV